MVKFFDQFIGKSEIFLVGFVKYLLTTAPVLFLFATRGSSWITLRYKYFIILKVSHQQSPRTVTSFFFFPQHNFAHHSLIRQESYKHMDPAYQVRTFNLCLSSTLHYVTTFLMKKRNLKRNESPTCELYDTYDLRASLRVFPKISKTRRSPRKKQRSQDWSEDLKIDQNLLIKLNTQI